MWLRGAVWLLLMMVQGSHCRIFSVDCEGGSNHGGCGWPKEPCGTIAHAIGRAQHGDVIKISPGVCKGLGNTELGLYGKAIAIEGRGDGEAIVDCKGEGRAFVVSEFEGADTIIRGITIQGCHADYGGGMFIDNASPTVQDVFFKNNRADVAGGGLYWKVSGPHLKGLRHEGNRAIYGADAASDLHRIGVVEGYPIDDFRSGDQLWPVVRASLLDAYDSIIVTDSATVLTLRGHVRADGAVDAVVKGNDIAQVNNGVAVFKGARLIGKPGSTVRFVVADEERELESPPQTVRVRLCQSGEVQQGEECTPCEAGSFSSVVVSPCQPCPMGSVCYGGAQISALPGYYILSKNPLRVSRCPKPDRCLGGEYSSCDVGFTGPLCESCESGNYCLGACGEGICFALWALLGVAPCVALSLSFAYYRSYRHEEEAFVRSLVASSRKR